MRMLNTGIEISDTDLLALKNDLTDVEEWITQALTGKINNCKKRLINEWTPRLMVDPDVRSIPADEERLIKTITERRDYRDRNARESENPVAPLG